MKFVLVKAIEIGRQKSFNNTFEFILQEEKEDQSTYLQKSTNKLKPP
jgi:hypothetical protein